MIFQNCGLQFVILAKFASMETASFTGFLRTLLYIVLFYYIFKFVMRLLAPYLLKKAVEKVQQNMHDQASPYYNQQQPAPQEPKPRYPRATKKVGEYVDFEEIEEK